MARIPLADYARRNGRDVSSARQMAVRGSFQTARKEGRDWFIDENEAYPDLRVKSGKYIGWKTKLRSRKNRKRITAVEENNTHSAVSLRSDG